jgi:hypothetical protein
MRLCDASPDALVPSAIAAWRAVRVAGFVPKLLRFDESRCTLSLGL